jgi:GNAT superfamily N-acetyltransferase
MNYVINSDPSWIDIDLVWHFLSEESYWARGVPRDTVIKSMTHSICFGVYQLGLGSDRKQAGFARVVSDRATFAYLADVFILPQHRGHGLSKRLLEAVLADPELQNLRRWLLFTADAHSLYEKFGFSPAVYPERIMEIRKPYIGDQ